MFRRTFWFTAGAAAGVWATTKVNRKLKQLSPESLAAQAANKAVEAGHKLKDFALDVRDNMAEREAQLGDALGLNDPVDRELPAQRRFAVIQNTATDKQPKYLGNTRYSIDNRNEDH
ncbi:DUF6167 family protein [Streptomyces sp. VRA16 Mangrove soil]|uniref:DUF6167 family protein n=1 Tax=Streptomyces sp. VRA16 Mangrove soil TaxID=2817434 RepID=UPI001A9F8392|nr:DUF6167 family protein [Streptomyces sp. VRA16 Mangrove soil]MBO1331615.1 hypothetical protein [Streptomyces sp. VRA16 Mangrove soil]